MPNTKKSCKIEISILQGFVPGVFGISHGAIQFMTYEEMKNYYNKMQHRPVDTRLVSLNFIFSHSFDL